MTFRKQAGDEFTVDDIRATMDQLVAEGYAVKRGDRYFVTELGEAMHERAQRRETILGKREGLDS